MSWKIFKKEISSLDFNDETKFILGIDMGTKSTKIAFWNVNRKLPELIDMSGGYGSPSIPTVIQYIPENKEWVYGEYAFFNKGYFNDITIYNILSKLGTKELIDINGKPINIPSILSRYIKEIIEMCKNINPNGEVVGIVVAIPDYFSDAAKEELKRAFFMAGLDKALITFMSYRECILRYLYFEKNLIEEEKVLYVDYGGEEIRGGLIKIKPQNESNFKGENLSFLFNKTLGLNNIDKLLKELFINFYCEETKILKDNITEDILNQIETFVYQNKNLLFQNYYKKNPTKLYFNFAYPAFQKIISIEDMNKLISPFKKEIKKFINNLLDKTIYGPISKKEVNKVIVAGGGFEMNWVKELFEKEFEGIEVIYPKQTEGIISLGACIGAASYLGIIKEKEIHLIDKQKLNIDIGIKAIFKKENSFIPLIEKNTFWWEIPKPKIFILNLKENNILEIPLYKRNDKGDLKEIHTITLKNLPHRPSRTIRLKFLINFKNYNTIEATISDCGFGEIFPSSGFSEKFVIPV
ncbi:DUF5716 family protein [Defluviitalea phaphyphila]|uniref:DUF5716 family protein n=1 Tax=Defluviitalea phaphyphila TaxID=1473580 RepID=UPI00073110A0|nr:DUF5716 family protein [Defluviitalea phaphyphila]